MPPSGIFIDIDHCIHIVYDLEFRQQQSKTQAMKQLRFDIAFTLILKVALLYLLWSLCFAPIKHHKLQAQEVKQQLLNSNLVGENTTNGRQ